MCSKYCFFKCLIGVCVLSNVIYGGSYFVPPLYNAEESILKNTLAPTVEKLSRALIAEGDPISAYKINMDTDTVSSAIIHEGIYFDAVIKTLVVKDNQINVPFSHAPGFQEILFLHPYDSSQSTSWALQNIGGEDFIVHDHGTFEVFSNADSQYVQLKP